ILPATDVARALDVDQREADQATAGTGHLDPTRTGELQPRDTRNRLAGREGRFGQLELQAELALLVERDDGFRFGWRRPWSRAARDQHERQGGDEDPHRAADVRRMPRVPFD